MKKINDYTPYLDGIKACALFDGLAEDELAKATDYLDGSVRSYEKGEIIQGLGAEFLRSGVVLEGTVEGSFISESYNKISIDYFPAGASFGEALACTSPKHSPVQLRAMTDCTLLMLNLNKLFSACDLPEHYQQLLSVNLIRRLARQNVFSNLKLRIANQKSIRDRVLMYLHSLTPDADGYLTLPFNQTAFAEFLGVNRSALSRELGNMQDDGLITLNGKKIKLLMRY